MLFFIITRRLVIAGTLIILLLLPGSYHVACAQVPAINRIEYFVDTDPGYGQANNVSFTGTTDASGTINIDLVPVNPGVHIVGVRSRDENGSWSLDNRWLFVKPYNGNSVVQPSINRVEWYLDTDPGYGIGNALSFSSGQDISGLNFSIDMLPLQQGVHIVGVRSRDANGSWSLDNKWLFVKPYSGGVSTQPNINLVEWYIDTDPGYGNGTSLSFSPGQDIGGLSFNIDMLPLLQGVHIVGARSRDANGAWSHDNKWLFVKPYVTNSVVQPSINRVEWYLDTDPGYGNGTPVAITSAQDIPSLLVNLPLGTLNPGVHIFGIRSRDATGAWSLDNKWLFLLPYNPSGSVPNIVRMEYFIDTDPGYGNASSITITPAGDISALVFNADISNIINGPHKLGIRSMDANGAWSLDNKVDFIGGTGISWIGAVSNDWATPGNWSKGYVPTATDDTYIRPGTPFPPVVATGINAVCKSIRLFSGATVTVNTGGNLKVSQ